MENVSYIVVLEDESMNARMAQFDGPDARYLALQFADESSRQRKLVCTVAQLTARFGQHENIGKVCKEVEIKQIPIEKPYRTLKRKRLPLLIYGNH
jgi:hypothetical protein